MWYYADLSRQRQGPVAAEQLASLYAQGLVTAESLVWRQGLPNWQPLISVAAELGIASAPVSAPPPPPPVANPYGYASAPPAPAPYGHNPYAAPQADLGSGYAEGDLSDAVPAGFWKRFSALMIDQFVFLIAMIPIVVVLAVVMGTTGAQPGAGFEALWNLISLIGGLAYFALMESSRSMATLGKRARGLKVVRSDGTRLTLGRAIGRYFAKIPAFLIFGIGFLMAAFTERKQGLHDMLADTLVIAENPEKARLDGVDFLLIALGLLAPILMVLAIGIAAFAAMGGMR